MPPPNSPKLQPWRAPQFSNPLAAKEILLRNGLESIGHQVIYLDSVNSTNLYAKSPGAHHLTPGAVILSEYQTEGRGRQGRQWLAPMCSSLLVSVLLPRDFCATPSSNTDIISPWLTAIAALSMIEAVEIAGGPKLFVDWPNDIVSPDDDAKEGGRKIGGVLVEPTDNPELVVVGVGLNVDTKHEEFPTELADIAGSLFSIYGPPPARSEIFVEYLRRLERSSAKHLNANELKRKLQERMFTLSRTITLPDGSTALAQDINDDMSLVVELTDGSKKTINFRRDKSPDTI